ncbi:MAG: hypothetical protein JWO12_1961 [Frankiales bacterium]|nr:hypothetical protein [Frankiales bacterium]
MALNSRHFDGVTAEDVFAVLSDGETYAYWVVGTRKIREVTPGWPAPGSAIHYTVGHLPLRKDDRTMSVECERPRRLKLEAHAWPIGSLHIELRVAPSPSGCTVTIKEGPKKGLLKTIDNPLIDLAIKARNVETLRRLEKKTRERVAQPS